MKRTTIRDLAAAAGVSIATVSRALRNDPRQAMATRKRIRELADEMGYVPDAMITTWVNRRWGNRRHLELDTLAWVTAYATRSGWKEFGHFARLARQGAEEHARARGYGLEEFWLTEPGMNEARLSQILRNRGIRGVCVAPLPGGRTRMDLAWEHFASVTVGYSLQEPHLHRATPHQFQGMSEALRALREAGYRHVGFCMSEVLDQKTNHYWAAAALLFAERNSVRISRFGEKGFGADEFGKWFRRIRPDVVLATGEFILDWLEQLQIKVPVAVLSWVEGVPCAGLDQKSLEVGRAAVDILIGQIQRNERGIPATPRTLMIEGIWREAASR